MISKFRVARHTAQPEAIYSFYGDTLGLHQLGEFKDHAGYDGFFLGLPDSDWHLEFTTTEEAPNHTPDDDDLLVFYLSSAEKYQILLQRFKAYGHFPVKPKNPYWEANGTTFADPDGFRIVISVAK